MRGFFNVNFECSYHICKCEYSVIYFRHEAKKLAWQKELDCESQSDALTQPKLNSFFIFTNALARLTSERLLDVEDTDKAMALTITDLSNSNTLSQNV